ncbi:MAG: ATP-dependent RecD-like DNA helicase [Bacilli bacterium]|nr:ATP-dependent RecD-like DNA helicase [Bacilli bacterium]
MESYIKGQYRKSIFQGDNGYTIGIFKLNETNVDSLLEYVGRTLTFTGYFHDLNEIDTYIFYGKFVIHPKYGDQFQVEKYEITRPVEKDAIIEFLSSGLFKGIGEQKAKKIVKVLGRDTFDIITNHPSNLLLIPTITKKNVDILHQGLLEYESSYETILYLNKIGFSTKDSIMIYHKYQNDSILKVEDNIYQLIEDMGEMTFKKIDLIAQKLNIKKDADIRIDAIIIYIMNELSNAFGHSYFKYSDIYMYLPRILGFQIEEQKFIDRLDSLKKNLKIVEYQENYYLKNMFDAEVLIASRFLLLTHQADNFCRNLDQELELLEQEMSIHYNLSQKEAIKNSILKNLLIITGGPGTGKTTILKAIVELYRRIYKWNNREIEENIALLAPTGRAAKRMNETTLFQASTIHRFLKWNKDTDTFLINEYNKSNVKILIVDEASMIDTYLFNNLLKGVSVNTRIILIGDYDQLPSVGAGQLLHDAISSNVLNVCYLNKLYRQGEDSNIIRLAYHIKDGEFDKSIFNQKDDLTFIECYSDLVLSNICDIASTYQDLGYKKFQVLAPMYKTDCGIDQINLSLQNIFNSSSGEKNEIKVGEVVYREQDKVIQLTNQPDDNVYNGDIGIIHKISQKKGKEIIINFDGNLVRYTPSNFSNFKLAYAISVHKSQGSEFDVVVIPIVRGFHKMLYRKLIYTAITRSKKKLYLIGDYTALGIAIQNIKVDIRNTTIKEFLKNGINY